MSTVGLTKAMRRALEKIIRGQLPSPLMLKKAIDAGFAIVDIEVAATPRGVSAFLAWPMSSAEYSCMCRVARHDSPFGESGVPVVHRLIRKGWVFKSAAALIAAGTPVFYLTPAGRTALNNVRAAMGSPDWKEGFSP